jgi:hypothetical protein
VPPEEDAVSVKRHWQGGAFSPEAIGAFSLPQKGASCPENQQDIVATARLYKKYLKGKALKDAMIQLAHYLSGRRVYKALYGERAPKAPVLQSIWKGLKTK